MAGFLSRMEHISDKDLHSSLSLQLWVGPARLCGSTRAQVNPNTAAARKLCKLMTHQPEREHHLLAGCSREAPLCLLRRAESEQNQLLPGRTRYSPVRPAAAALSPLPPIQEASASCQGPTHQESAQSSSSAEEQNHPNQNLTSTRTTAATERSEASTTPYLVISVVQVSGAEVLTVTGSDSSCGSFKPAAS